MIDVTGKHRCFLKKKGSKKLLVASVSSGILWKNPLWKCSQVILCRFKNRAITVVLHHQGKLCAKLQLLLDALKVFDKLSVKGMEVEASEPESAWTDDGTGFLKNSSSGKTFDHLSVANVTLYKINAVAEGGT